MTVFTVVVVVVGASGAGKSQLLLRYTMDRFNESSKATIGVDFGHKSLNIEGKVVRAQIWDTAGQERFKAIMPKFYAGTHGALIVYSIVDRNSFDAVGDWLDELKRQTDCRFIMLVGNKSDLEATRAVTRAEGQEFASANDLLFMETSAKMSTNVDEAFSAVIKEIFEDTTNPANRKYDVEPEDNSHSTSGPTVVLKQEVVNDPQPKRGCPC
jgi:small GTP-binding protein